MPAVPIRYRFKKRNFSLPDGVSLSFAMWSRYVTIRGGCSNAQYDHARDKIMHASLHYAEACDKTCGTWLRNMVISCGDPN